ncbi:Thiamine biosynthesis lipoprotein ApbE precursor [Anatilimnocola aggregata]|uniref:FAD:protein FMN transferase n=1 Tax=Anatilimnocola aggregata TaxID=2528021 RepID=A0A517YCJ3_9BACT|nr:DUF2271 domain-containing protein [Anatilimnocola aggregata]QDU27954.1 Thiamine biosynthesis lipoprotein ApbE precursor [Anatilimnocola aggregata]
MSVRWSAGRWSASGFVSLFALGLLLLSSGTGRAENFVFHHEHVLGTSLEIQLQAASATAANEAEARILREIDRQAKVFSTYDATSELTQWQATKDEAHPVSRELFAIMQASDNWTKLSGGAFNPAVESVTKVWQQAAEKKQLPSDQDVSAAVKLAATQPWKLDTNKQTATRLTTAPLTFNAIAKGAIVDAACRAAAHKHPEIHGVLINIGGDLRVAGDTFERVAIADPFHDAVNAEPITTIFVRNRAVATSGNYRRGVQIGDKWYSHIIDPRSGQPVDHVVSATVVAHSSIDADALATICSVLTPNESLALVESHGAACLLITRDGKRLASAGWTDFEQPQLFRLATAFEKSAFEKPAQQAQPQKQVTEQVALVEDAKGELLELAVNIELSRPAGAQYRRPYAAVWLEDADEFPVRTGLLFMMTKGNGSRWHRDLLRWYRQDNVRKLADDTSLIDTISSATRGPGEYKAVFDGKDDAGKPLKPGKYTLFIEVAREHGTYQIIRQPLELGTKPIEKTNLKSNVEIKSATYEYRKPVARAAGQ